MWSWFFVLFCKMIISPSIFFFLVFQNFDFSSCYGGKVHLCKMIISPGVFFFHFFKFFKILNFWVIRGVKMYKMVQTDQKFCLLRSIFQEPYIKWLPFMVHMCKKIIYPSVFFIFWKFWIFGLVVSGVKGQKTVQNDKNFCPSHSITQEPYIIWFSFVVYMYKMIISPGSFFHFFKILIFRVVRGMKGQKTVQNDKKFCLLYSMSQEPYIIWLSFIVHICKIIISSEICFRFFKILKKQSKMKKSYVCRAPYFRNHMSHLWCKCVKW